MSKKLSNFNYEIVDSKIKNHHEIKVTYDYKGKQINYFVFVENKANYNNNDYIKAAKQKINQEVESNKLTKYARHYLHPFTFCKPTQIAIAALGATTIAFAALFCYKMLYHEPVEPITNYLVTWDLGNNKTLVENYPIGAIPDYKGMKPTIPDDTEIDSEGELYHYEFNGWDRPFAPVTENTTYHAQFEKISKVAKFTLNIPQWVIDEGDEFGINDYSGELIGISWDDNQTELTTELSHNYTTEGIHHIKIYGSPTSFGINQNMQKCTSELYLPWGLKRIPDNAFNNLGSEISSTTISIPNTVTEIGSSAFENSNITFLYIPESVMYIGNSAFAGCALLTDIIFEDNSQLAVIPSSFAAQDTSLRYVNFGKNSRIHEMRNAAFYNDQSLNYINFPNTLKIIEDTNCFIIPNSSFCIYDLTSYGSELKDVKYDSYNIYQEAQNARAVVSSEEILNSVINKFAGKILLSRKCNVVSNKYKVNYPEIPVAIKPTASVDIGDYSYWNIISSVSNPDEHPTQDKIHAYVGDEDISNLIEYHRDPAPEPQSTPAGYLTIHAPNKVTGDITLVIDD